MKTIAEIHYRGYVPSGWFAITICDIYFSGKNSNKFSDDCHKIKFYQYNIYQPKYEKLEQEIEKQKLVIKDTNKWYNLFETKEEKKLLEMEKELIELGKKILKSERLLFTQFENYLEKNGFYKKSSSRGSGELGYVKELYEKTYEKENAL